MKELTWFYMKGCPYCAQAGRALEELKKGNPSYENVSIHQIDENAEPETADKYDYY
ncbi:MAG: glutaredoxin, partial [Lachnospiraceae bacterium]|nr:glutaredoxin [Lachnospiraceae bacterium]